MVTVSRYEYMSMIENGSNTPSTPADDEITRLEWASAVARYSYNRRKRLGLTIGRAAELAGMEQSQWVAMENHNWIPEKLSDCQAIAATLEVSWSDFDLVAMLARYAQQRG